MNIIDAAYATAHDYPGGTESLAPRIGMSGAILRGKVNPKDVSHHLTLAEAQRMMAMSGDVRILLALADALDYVCIPVPNFKGVADIELLDAYLAMMADQGQFAGDFRTALQDGRIERREYEQLRDDLRAQQAHEMELLARIESMVVSE